MPIVGGTPVPTRLLSYTLTDGELVPSWLSDRDRPWLRDLIWDSRAFVGRPFTELTRRWQVSVDDPRAGRRQAIAQHALTTMLRASGRPPSRTRIRRQLFALAATGVARQSALHEVAAAHDLTAEQLQATLFHDLPAHRLVTWPEAEIDASMLSLRANVALVRGMLRHAQHIVLDVLGGTRALLKTAWLRGAHVDVLHNQAGTTRLTWQRTVTNPRSDAIGSLLALLPWTNRYRLRADCIILGDRGDVVLSTGDPLQPGPEPRLFDSLLEQSFAHDFARAMPDWVLVREPTAIATTHGLAFPDFALQPPHRAPGWLCEVAGLRDGRALEAKLALLDAHPRLILCLPQAVVVGPLCRHARIVPFRRRIPIDLVTAAMRSDS